MKMTKRERAAMTPFTEAEIEGMAYKIMDERNDKKDFLERATSPNLEDRIKARVRLADALLAELKEDNRLMSMGNKAFSERYEQLPNGKYGYTPKEQVMFGKDVEQIFQKEADKIEEDNRLMKEGK